VAIKNFSLWNALEHYQRAVKINPKNFNVLSRLGRLLVKYGAYTEAYPFLARAAELNARPVKLVQEAEAAGKNGYLLF